LLEPLGLYRKSSKIARTDLEWIQISPRADMPWSNYESWVQPTKAISFEDDRFVVGSFDDYGRRWLESRLTAIIRRMVECEVGGGRSAGVSPK